MIKINDTFLTSNHQIFVVYEYFFSEIFVLIFLLLFCETHFEAPSRFQYEISGTIRPIF